VIILHAAERTLMIRNGFLKKIVNEPDVISN
jgi:hypothetical protein